MVDLQVQPDGRFSQLCRVTCNLYSNVQNLCVCNVHTCVCNPHMCHALCRADWHFGRTNGFAGPKNHKYSCLLALGSKKQTISALASLIGQPKPLPSRIGSASHNTCAPPQKSTPLSNMAAGVHRVQWRSGAMLCSVSTHNTIRLRHQIMNFKSNNSAIQSITK